jgi:hypothetical protein
MGIHMVGMFCEDIREEKNGQLTLVGLLADNVNIPPPPAEAPPTTRAVMPKLAFYLRIHMAVEDEVAPMNVKLLIPDGGEIDLGTIGADLIAKAQKEAADKGLPIAGIVSQTVIQGFRIVLGKLYGAVETKGERYICAVLNFAHEASPTQGP